ncbi:capsid cement protein [Stratiformator vulcanicus]|uniref:Uncharacterized protein n=1 Tax=Stratiformator vulcanicus TaxID=2527980 RepID=A0A517QWS1_9PLAN|nr:capsid cement protein [Stratiformator vulcanicus]QDT36109.1 hypothetical protein Pan189_04640 [Stratiformator vulcanicus]
MSAHKLRFRSGQVQLRKVRVGSDTVIDPGDLLFLDSGVAKPAADFAWDTDLATTRAAFAAAFLGVAHSRSIAGETDPVSVDISPLSVYELETAAAAFELGDTLAPDEATETLTSTTLEKATDATHAIARAAEYAPTGSTRLRVQFASAFHPGSANANAAVG